MTRNPIDRRSMLLRLTPAMEKAATEACAPLVARLDNLIKDLPAGEREAVTGTLNMSLTQPRSTPTASLATPPLARRTRLPSHARRYGRNRTVQERQPREPSALSAMGRAFRPTPRPGRRR